MSGHSKWSQIKRQKGAADVKRGTLYTKLAKVISVAVKEGGGKDPQMNVRLRLAIDRARGVNMPGATIERAILRGAGELGGAQIERVVYEGYGPGGVAFLVDAMTDNKNRTTAEVRHAFTSFGGNIGGSGSVQWMFGTKGVLTVPAEREDEEQELLFIDAGAEDVEWDEGVFTLITPLEKMESVRETLTQRGLTVKSAEMHLIPTNAVPIPDSETAKKIHELVERLETLEDVTNVTTNAIG